MSTQPPERPQLLACRHLLDRYRIVDLARKVVGVGSVGTRDFVLLLEGRDQNDPLFLQVKEATHSVLETFGGLPGSRFADCGERVVHGQQLTQSASDIFLGWSAGVRTNRHYYWRQLRDMKASLPVEQMVPDGLTYYASAYADQNERDYEAFRDAVSSGRLDATAEA